MLPAAIVTAIADHYDMKHKTLYILRHAKTEPAASGQDDHKRQLMPRGREDARAIGRYLVRQGIRPKRVVCSTATRCRETWEALTSPSPLVGEGGVGGSF